MISRSLLLIYVLTICAPAAFSDDSVLSESLEDLQDSVTSFNLARPKDFPPLLVEDLLCARELDAENTIVADAFPSLPDLRLSKADRMSADKPKLRQFRQTLAGIVARRKAPNVKKEATLSTRFGPSFRELGQNILALINDIDAALKTDSPGDYLKAARRVRQGADALDQTFERSYRAFKYLDYEYDTVTALSQGKPRPIWKEPEPSTPATRRKSSLEVQID